MQDCTSFTQAISDLKEMCYRMVTEGLSPRVKTTKNEVHNSPVSSAVVTNAYRNTQYILMARAHDLVDRHGQFYNHVVCYNIMKQGHLT